MEIRLPEEWKDWMLIERIGKGSYGTVYKANCSSEGSEKISAVKIIDIPQDQDELEEIRCEYDNEESVYAYFNDRQQDILNEIKLMASLKGMPNIVQLEDYYVEKTGSMSWRIFIRMEYLQDFWKCSSEHEMSNHEIIMLALDVCNALIVCEKQGVLHRDIKPGNILYSSKEDAYKLSDFGSSREEEFSVSYSVKGTFSYMAPEVYMGQSYGKSADIYSLGITLYRLLNRNRFPFENVFRKRITYSERESALMRRLNGERLPEPINADEPLAGIILRACAFNPEDRYENAKEMKDDLLKLAEIQEAHCA